MYGTDLHTFGDLTGIRHICQNCKNRQIVSDIFLAKSLERRALTRAIGL